MQASLRELSSAKQAPLDARDAADPALAAEVNLGHFESSPYPNLPACEDGSYNMVADDGQICGTAPEWGFPYGVATNYFARRAICTGCTGSIPKPQPTFTGGSIIAATHRAIQCALTARCNNGSGKAYGEMSEPCNSLSSASLRCLQRYRMIIFRKLKSKPERRSHPFRTLDADFSLMLLNDGPADI
jgi:hypothetical protein